MTSSFLHYIKSLNYSRPFLCQKTVKIPLILPLLQERFKSYIEFQVMSYFFDIFIQLFFVSAEVLLTLDQIV